MQIAPNAIASTFIWLSSVLGTPTVVNQMGFV